MTTPDSSARRESRFRRWTSRIDPALLMLLVGPVMICFAWIVTITQLNRERGNALAAGYREANGLSRTFAELTQHSLDDLDHIVRVVREGYRTGQSRDHIVHLLTSAGFRDPDNIRVAVLDTSNRVLAGRAPDAPDWLATVLPHAGPVADRPMLSVPLRADGRHLDTVAFSRPILREDGTLAGNVVAFVRPEYILRNLRRINVEPMARQFGTIDLGEDDIAALLGVDGRVRAALRHDKPIPTAKWPLGTAIYRAANGYIRPMPNPEMDAIPRLWSGGYLAEYEMMVVVGTSRQEALREFERRRRLYLIGTSAFTLGVGMLTVMAAVLARRQRRTLQRLAASEREANELKSTFVAKISHDLRTPLNGILGFSELVKTTAGEAEQRQYGEYIHDSATHLLDLVNMILDLTKLRSGKLRLQLHEVDLREVARSVSRTHAIVAEGKGLAYRLEIAEDFPAVVVCDGVRIREVMNNLLHNAIKFTKAGHVAMLLSAAGERVIVRVSDTGFGMSEEAMRNLFVPFGEVSDPKSQPQTGTGLGLAFSKELVVLHGGEIEVDSTPGQGTTVTFWVPVGGAALPATPVPQQ